MRLGLQFIAYNCILVALLALFFIGIDFRNSQEYWVLSIVNLGAVISQLIFLAFIWAFKSFEVKETLAVSGLYLLFWYVVYILVYSDYTGDFFDFQRGDTLYYSNTALDSLNLELSSFLQRLWNTERIDDIGVLLYTRILYSIIASPLFIYTLNWIISLVSFTYLFKLSRILLQKNQALIVAFLFISSSYFIYFGVSLFKEQVFVLLTILTLYVFQKIQLNLKRSTLSYVQLIFLLVSLSLFRVITPLIILASFGLNYFIQKWRFRLTNIFLILPAMGVLIAIVWPIFINYYGSKFNLEFIAFYIEKSGYNISGTTKLLLSYFSAFFSPIPSLFAWEGHLIPNFYLPGYLIKITLVPFFVRGVYYVFKNHAFGFRFLLFNYLIGSLIFGTVMRGFDIRFQITHAFIYYIIAVFGMTDFRLRKGTSFAFMAIYQIMLLTLILAFNFR